MGLASPNGTRPSPLAPMVTGEESDTLGDTDAQLSPASPVAKPIVVVRDARSRFMAAKKSGRPNENCPVTSEF